MFSFGRIHWWSQSEALATLSTQNDAVGTLEHFVLNGRIRTRTRRGARQYRMDDVQHACAQLQHVSVLHREIDHAWARYAQLNDFVSWLISLDNAARIDERKRVTLHFVIQRARDALRAQHPDALVDPPTEMLSLRGVAEPLRAEDTV